MSIRPRTCHLLLTLALLVGCKQDPSNPPDTTGPAAEDGASGEVGGEGGAGEPVDVSLEDLGIAGDEPSFEDPAKPRERERSPAPKTRDAALVAVAHGNPEGAIETLSAHLANTPDDGEASLALARAQGLVGARDEAEKILDKLQRKTKDQAQKVEALRRLAWLRYERGDIAKAEQHIRAALKLAPDDLLLRGELVRLMFVTGRADERECRELVDGLYASYSDGTAQSAAQLLGTAYAGLAERAFQSTSRVLQEAEQAAPPAEGSVLGDQINMQLADLFLEKYKPQEAAVTVSLVLERDPWNPDALAKMGWIALEQFQLAPASRVANEALQVDPEHPDAHAVLGWIALIEGRRAEARAHIVDHTLKINPAHRYGQMVLAAIALFDHDKAGYAKARDAVMAAAPVDGRFFSQLSDLLGYLHLYPEGDAVLEDGAERLAKDPYIQAALGLSKIRLGDEILGRAALEKAWRKDKYNARTQNVRRLYAERIEPDYAERTERDLTLRLPSELQDLVAPGYVEAISAARKGLDKAYGINISPLRIELYAEPEAFSVRTVGVPSLGALGVCFGPVITAIGPYAGTHNFNQVIWHEIAHSYAIELSEGRVPRWFTEGLSEWESEVADPSWARESAALLYEARRMDKLRKLSELELAFLRAESPMMMEVAYATAAWAMRYLGTTYGRPKLIELLKGYAKGKSTDELFAQILGKDLATVEAEFSAWFDSELDRKLGGWRPNLQAQDDARVTTLRKAMEAYHGGQLDVAQAALEELVNGKGDGFHTRMGLGSVLAEKGDHAGAIQQFEAAAKFQLESVDPYVGIAKIAREQGNTAVELDQFEKILAIDAMSVQPALRMAILAAAVGDKRLGLAVSRANAIAPLHPVALAGSVIVLSQRGGNKQRIKAMLDEAMVTALRPDAGLESVVMTALAADAIGDPRVADLAPRALQSKELPEPARKKLKKHAP